MKTLSLKLTVLACCFYVTSSFAGPCWKNQIEKSIMPQKVCFDEIFLESKKGEFKNVYLSNSDIEESMPLASIKKQSDGSYEVTFKSDYLNYSENCGLNLFSKIDFFGYFSAEGKYIHHEKSQMKMSYTYTSNNCRNNATPGSEEYKPIK